MVRRKRLVKKATPMTIEEKIEVVKASKLPEEQKKAVLGRLEKKDVIVENKVSFEVYCKVRKIKSQYVSGMLACPKKRGVKEATLVAWDEMFKDF